MERHVAEVGEVIERPLSGGRSAAAPVAGISAKVRTDAVASVEKREPVDSEDAAGAVKKKKKKDGLDDIFATKKKKKDGLDDIFADVRPKKKKKVTVDAAAVESRTEEIAMEVTGPLSTEGKDASVTGADTNAKSEKPKKKKKTDDLDEIFGSGKPKKAKPVPDAAPPKKKKKKASAMDDIFGF